MHLLPEGNMEKMIRRRKAEDYQCFRDTPYRRAHPPKRQEDPASTCCKTGEDVQNGTMPGTGMQVFDLP